MAASKERFASCSIKDFHSLRELYRSSTGAVFRATFRYDGKDYVLKERSLPELGRRRDIMNEVNLLLQLEHPNVVNCLGWFRDDVGKRLFIVLEYCTGGDLHSILEQRRHSGMKYLEEHQIWFIFLNICRGLCHLHEHGIVHRDLKSLNILCASENARVFKLGDLGVSRQVSEDTVLLKSFYGTPLYLSPELVESRPYNEKTDIWSLGILLYEMAALTTPFKADTLLGVAKLIVRGQYEDIPTQYSRYLRRCIAWLLNLDFKKRPNIVQLIDFVEQRQRTGYSGGRKILLSTDRPQQELQRTELDVITSARSGLDAGTTYNDQLKFRDAGNMNKVGEGCDPLHLNESQVSAAKEVERLNPTEKHKLAAVDVHVDDECRDSLDLQCTAKSSVNRVCLPSCAEGPSKCQAPLKPNSNHQATSRNEPDTVFVERQRLQQFLRKEITQFRKLLKLRDFANSSVRGTTDAVDDVASEYSEDRDERLVLQQQMRANCKKTAHDITERKCTTEELRMKAMVSAKQHLITQLERVLSQDCSNSISIPMQLAEHYNLIPQPQHHGIVAGQPSDFPPKEDGQDKELKRRAALQHHVIVRHPNNGGEENRRQSLNDANNMEKFAGIDINHECSDMPHTRAVATEEVPKTCFALDPTADSASGASAAALNIGAAAAARRKKMKEPLPSKKPVLFNQKCSSVEDASKDEVDRIVASVERVVNTIPPLSKKDLLAEEWERAGISNCLPVGDFHAENRNSRSRHRRADNSGLRGDDIFVRHPYAPRPKTAAPRLSSNADGAPATSLNIEALAQRHRRPQHRRIISDITRLVESTKRRSNNFMNDVDKLAQDVQSVPAQKQSQPYCPECSEYRQVYRDSRQRRRQNQKQMYGANMPYDIISGIQTVENG